MQVCQRMQRHLWELGIPKRLIVSPAVYPRFLEIAELEQSLSAIAELLVFSLVRFFIVLLTFLFLFSYFCFFPLSSCWTFSLIFYCYFISFRSTLILTYVLTTDIFHNLSFLHSISAAILVILFYAPVLISTLSITLWWQWWWWWWWWCWLLFHVVLAVHCSVLIWTWNPVFAVTFLCLCLSTSSSYTRDMFVASELAFLLETNVGV